jgi:hypothetical protein
MHNYMEYLGLISTQILLFCAFLFYIDDFPEKLFNIGSKTILSVFCIFFIVVSSVAIVALIFFDFMVQYATDKAPPKYLDLEMDSIDIQTKRRLLKEHHIKPRALQTTDIFDLNGQMLGEASLSYMVKKVNEHSVKESEPNIQGFENEDLEMENEILQNNEMENEKIIENNEIDQISENNQTEGEISE